MMIFYLTWINVADLIGRYIPLPKIENNIDIIKCNDGPLTKEIGNGNSGVLVNSNSAQSKWLKD